MPENIIYGSSYFEKSPVFEAGKTSEFRLKMFYKSGPYTINELKPIIEIYPLNLAQYITISSETIKESIHPITYVLVKGNITTSHDIPTGKVSIVYYFTAKDVIGNSYRSAWFESTEPIDIKNISALENLQELLEDARQTVVEAQIIIRYDDPPLKQYRYGISIEEIKCKEGFELVTKQSNSYPACVKPLSKQKLIENGWAVNDQIISEI